MPQKSANKGASTKRDSASGDDSVVMVNYKET